ncbi:hypothetical protein JCM15519_32830 [Fundidesulfovibrio butyratiphilus]
MRALLVVCTLIVLCSCSWASSKNAETETKQQKDKINEYLDMGRPKAALGVVDEMIAANPASYENYLTRNAVHLAMRDYDAARIDNEEALKAYKAQTNTFPEKERPVRLARIHESFALTALLASERAKDPQTKKNLEEEFRRHANTVRDLDEATYRHLRAMLGDTSRK